LEEVFPEEFSWWLPTQDAILSQRRGGKAVEEALQVTVIEPRLERKMAPTSFA